MYHCFFVANSCERPLSGTCSVRARKGLRCRSRARGFQPYMLPCSLPPSSPGRRRCRGELNTPDASFRIPAPRPMVRLIWSKHSTNVRQSFGDPFSAVSKPTFAVKFSVLRDLFDLQDKHQFALFQIQKTFQPDFVRRIRSITQVYFEC